MGNAKLFHILLITFSVTLATTPSAYGWGYEAHTAICRIAQARLTKAAASVVRRLLPATAHGDLGVVCPWADTVKLQYPWSSSSHFINTPDGLCTYSYARDCKGKNGVMNYCLEGAINNYTARLTGYRRNVNNYNLTEALMFLSHFMGDIHQPLHVGFTTDRGGNTIQVKWFNRATVLHHVWDTDIVQRAQGKGVNATTKFISNIQQKINTQWVNQIQWWEGCNATCATLSAQESMAAACGWAYKGVKPYSILGANYLKTRLPIVEMRIAQAGVRLAAALNHIFI